MSDLENETARPATISSTLEVYWRPGCPYCVRLLGVLERAAVAVELHNIWQDDQAREFVRAHNRGNETVPTVVLGEHVMTNPGPAALLDEVRREHAHLIGSAGSAHGPER